ncbi:MAG: hypothetical protein U0326_36530 [Polyangiales bacterium]
MSSVLFGFDLATPRMVAVGMMNDRAIVLSRGELAAGERDLDASELRGWDWERHDADTVEALADALLTDARGRYVLHADARCEAVLCLPRSAGAQARDAVLRGAARADVEVLRCMGPAEALAMAAEAHREHGVTVSVSVDLGHVEVGVFEARGGSLYPHALRDKAVALGDLFVEDVVSWVSFTIDHKHHAQIADARELRWLLAGAAREALAHAPEGEPLRIATPFLFEGGGPASVTATTDVLALAFDDVVERVAAMIDDALRASGVSPGRVARLVIAGRQSRVSALGERLASRWSFPLIAVDHTAAATGAAREAARIRLGEHAPAQSAPPSWAPPSAPPSTQPSMRHAAPPDLSSFEAHAPSSPPSIPPRPSIPPPAAPSGPPAMTPTPPRPATPTPAPFARVPTRPVPLPGANPSPIPPSRAASPQPPPRPSTPPQAPSSAPPQRPSSLPPVTLAEGEIASARLPRAGAFTGSPSLNVIFAMPLTRAAVSAELARPLPFAALLSQIGMRPHLHGTLSLHGESEVVRIGIDGGTPVLHPAERQRALRCFQWREGHYELSDAKLAGFSMAVHETMTGLVVAGLRPLLRDLTNDECLAALGERIHLAPVLRPDREKRLHRMRLTAAEERTVTRGLDASTDLAAHLRNSSSMLRLAMMLELFEIVSWAPPMRDAREDRRAELARRVARMSSQNHFEVLFIHWTASGEEVLAAWKKFQAEYGPAGPWHEVDRELARAALTRGEAAWSLLSNEARRVRYRAEAYPTVNQELLTPLIESRARILDFAGEKAEALNMVRLLKEIQGGVKPGGSGS